MRAALDHFPVIQDNDLITVPYSGQSVGNHDTCYSSVLDGIHYFIFRPSIKGGGSFVKNDYSGILRQDPCDLHSLSLSSGEIIAAFSHPVFIPAFSLYDVAVDMGIPCCHYHFKVLYGLIPHSDI